MIRITLRYLALLATALWLGGIVGIGAFAAPAAFHAVSNWAGVAEPRVLAGKIIGDSLRHFNVVCLLASALQIADCVAVTGLRSQHSHARQWKSLANTICVAGLTLSASLLAFVLFPMLDAAQAAHNMGRFDALHHTYELVSRVQVPLLALLIATYTIMPRRSTLQ